MTPRIPIKLSMLLAILILLAGLLTACSSSTVQGGSDNLHMAPMSEMPAEVKSAPVSVQQAYQFNVANPELMKQIPCYCGCGAMGHTSNYDCYVDSVDDRGQVSFDDHALGCSICVDISQDAMRLSRQGKSASEIKAYVDQTYAQFGTSNIP